MELTKKQWKKLNEFVENLLIVKRTHYRYLKEDHWDIGHGP